MALFSQRKGIKPLFKQPQIESLDQETRNQIWTALTFSVFSKWTGNPYDRESTAIERLYQSIWSHHFKLPLDSTPRFNPKYEHSCYKELRELTLEHEWHSVLDLIEYVINTAPNDLSKNLREFINRIFERENVGYRIIGREIADITDPIETNSITDALAIPRESIKAHLGKALELLSERKTPDYRNSIKESISAVEAACKAITGMPSATLGGCLSAFKAKHPLHPAFEQALLKLYGYTSDSGGIRHSLTEQDSPPSFADAKFMLVSCTAFINYLWTLTAEAKINLGSKSS